MSWKIRQAYRSLLESESVVTVSQGGGDISVCVVSPSPYRTGMSSLGFQAVFALFSDTPGIRCERAFLPDREERAEYRRSATRLLSLESQRPLADFDVIAFSTSFEPDYLNIPAMLELAGIPLYAAKRGAGDPLIIAGGAAFMINPEPAVAFLDVVCIGEAEELVPSLVDALLSPSEGGRQGLLRMLSRLPGIYVPSLYQPHYEDGHLTGYDALDGAPSRIERICVPAERHPPATSRILTERTEFGDMFLVEVSRGCPRGCRFCTSGFMYAPFRQHRYETLKAVVDAGLRYRSKIGLVGSAVSDVQDIGRLCRHVVEQGGKVSVSSLRIDRIDSDMLDALVASGHKTISLAPEGGSQRMRDLMRKNLTEQQILNACDLLISRDILNLRLYAIIGLPTEDENDLSELVRLVLAIRERVLERARINRRLGEITLSVNPFIPKPFTPFQWCAMEAPKSLERKVRFLESSLRGVSNVKLKVESLRESYLQALLSRGDRRLAPLLAAMAGGASLKQAAAACSIDTASYVTRTIPVGAFLPWEVIASADDDLLRREHAAALKGSGAENEEL